MSPASLARNSLPLVALAAAGLLLATASCTSVRHAAPATQAAAAANYAARTTNRFEFARFFKPAETNVDDLCFKLAPLILQQTLTTNLSVPASDRFGRLDQKHGEPAVDPSRPAVYFKPGVAMIGNTLHPQLAYTWFYPTAAGRPGARRLAWRGVRITLDSAGRPAIWEVLADPASFDLVFVAHSLEDAAAAEFGPPLPGRRHAVERAPSEAPATVVARVIEDGPIPMGPIVYLTAGAREVSALICRCMPAQADAIVETRTYDLLPFPERGLEGLAAPVDAALRAGHPGQAGKLEERLRLPRQW